MANQIKKKTQKSIDGIKLKLNNDIFKNKLTSVHTIKYGILSRTIYKHAAVGWNESLSLTIRSQ